MDPAAFVELLTRARRGEESALRELVSHCEDQIVARIRRRLKRLPDLRREFDTGDVVQSVLRRLVGALLKRPDDEQPQFANAEMLAHYLARLAHRNILRKQKRSLSDKRDVRREDRRGDAPLAQMVGNERPPGEAIELEELRARIRAVLSPHEWRLFELREARKSWKEITWELGGSATVESLTKCYSRAREKVRRLLTEWEETP